MATTKGFRDVIVIRRGRKNVRTSMYNLFVPPYKALVPRHLRLEVGERSTYEGEVVEELNEDDVYAAAEKLQQKGVESVAICFLHSYANPGHERRAAEIVREVLDDDVYVTTSHEVLPVWREWERFSTTAVSAYVGPAVKAYLESLVARLDENGFGGELLIMLADGLVEAPENVIPRAVYLIGSGPAAAPAAALHYGESFGEQHLLSLDMGGTSTDLAFIQEGQIATTTEGWIEEERLAIKMVDISFCRSGRRLYRLGRLTRVATGRSPIGGEHAGASLLRARREKTQPPPMPTSCSATYPPTSSWAVRSLSILTGPQPRCGQRLPSRSV